MADLWDLEALTRKWQERWWQAGLHHADRDPATRPGTPDSRDGAGARPTYFLHFAYPGISGYLHVGHMRGFTYSDVFTRYKRMTGHDVLFPAGFHASGIPAVAFAKEVERGEKTEYLLSNGYDPERDGPIEDLADPAKVVEYFARVYTQEYWKKFGFLIDDRRNCTTIDPGYQRFIQWQFRRLNDLGYLIQKPHYAPFCPVAGPVAVDKSETDIKQGGSAEVQEFIALRFTVPAGELVDTDDARERPGRSRAEASGRRLVADDFDTIVVPCATLRPETVYGVTNLWIRPDHDYELVRTWRDGAVGDDDPSEVWLVSKQGRVKLEWQSERAEALGLRVAGEALVGLTATAPVTGAAVPIVAAGFVDPMVATGVVMSVPGHAPFDYAAYRDAGLVDTMGAPPQILDVEGYDGLPAKVACDRHGVTTQDDTEALAKATEEVYADEFNKGVLREACGPYAGERVKAVKDRIREDFTRPGRDAPGVIIRQFSEPVVSRAGEVVDIKRIPDQDFIHYADPAWTSETQAHAKTMKIFPQRYADDIENVLSWFGDRACVRRGAWLGTEFPFKDGWIIEPIADSTFYSWYYLVSLYVNDGRLDVDDLTDAFFDFVIQGKGDPAGDQREALWRQIRDDVLHWGPVDINLGGKEHQTVHFPVWVFNNVALLTGDNARLRPGGIFVNWWVTQKAGAKISKSKGGAEPIPGAARKYGVDPMRLYYCHVGSPHVDIEWDPDVVLTYRQRVERIARAAAAALDVDGGEGPMDAWLRSAFARHVRAARDAYEAYDLRTAATETAYGVLDTLRWYERRGGDNGDLLRGIVRDWAKLLSPIIPHLAEAMHERAGGEGLAAAAAFPEQPEPDAAALAQEEYLRGVLDDIQTVRKLAGIAEPEGLVLFTTPAWKRELTVKALRLADEEGGRLPMGRFMGDVMADPAMRARGKAVQQFAGRLAAQVTQFSAAQRALLRESADEASVLTSAADFVAREAGVARVDVFAADAADAPDHPKRAAAAPLKPGIALT